MKLKINIPDWNNCTTATISGIDEKGAEFPLKHVLGIHFSVHASKMDPKILLDIDLESYESIIDSNRIVLVDKDGTKYHISKIETPED